MTEVTERDPIRDPLPSESDWLVGDEPPADSDEVVAGPAVGGSGRRAALAGVGLVAAGALVGAVGVAALRPHNTTTATTQTGFVPGQGANGQLPNGQLPNGQLPNGQLPNGQLPNGQLQGGQGFPGAGGFGGGGVDGEQRLSGTVVSVTSSSIRLRTSAGTASYGVTSQSEIVRNGAIASLSSVKPGDSVFVHLVPSGSSSYVVERLFVTSSTSGGASDGENGTTGTTTGNAT